MLLEPGVTCWRREASDRAALLIDMADYFDAAKAAKMFHGQLQMPQGGAATDHHFAFLGIIRR